MTKIEELEQRMLKLEEKVGKLEHEKAQYQNVFKKLRQTHECVECDKIFASKNSLRYEFHF